MEEVFVGRLQPAEVRPTLRTIPENDLSLAQSRRLIFESECVARTVIFVAAEREGVHRAKYEQLGIDPAIFNGVRRFGWEIHEPSLIELRVDGCTDCYSDWESSSLTRNLTGSRRRSRGC